MVIKLEVEDEINVGVGGVRASTHQWVNKECQKSGNKSEDKKEHMLAQKHECRHIHTPKHRGGTYTQTHM